MSDPRLSVYKCDFCSRPVTGDIAVITREPPAILHPECFPAASGLARIAAQCVFPSSQDDAA